MDFPPASLPATLKRLAQSTIVSILNQITGTKDLVIHHTLISVLDMVCGFATLKEAGVNKIFKLEPCNQTPGTGRCCFFIHSEDLCQLRTVCDLILADVATARTREYVLIVTPRLTSNCEQLIEQSGVYGHVTILECPIFFCPIDVDIFSLERPNFYVDLFLNRSQASYYEIAKSIHQIINLFGCKVNTWCQGSIAGDVLRLTNILKAESNQSSEDIVDPNTQLDLLIIDRDVDMASLLLSQMCYQGVLDEEFEIESGKVTFPKEVVGSSQPSKHILHRVDPVFSEIRDCHISAVFGRLKDRSASLKRLQTSHQNMDVSELKDFVTSKLKSVQGLVKSLNLHVSACEYIKKRKEDTRFANQLQIERDLIQGIAMKDIGYIEDFIYKQENPLTSLRLMCLLCIVQDGVSSKQYRTLSKVFCQSFGHEHIVTLYHLKKLKLFYESNLTSLLSASVMSSESTGTRRRFKDICKKLNLIPSLSQNVTCDPKDPKDESFVFSGVYTPLVCSLLESIANGANEWKEVTSVLGGNTSQCVSSSGRAITSDGGGKKRIFAIYFIGGITYAEITALRFWAKRRGYKLAIFSTSLTSGNRLMRELLPVK